MKPDRRTRYTKAVIREAFLALIKEKPLNKVTVSDICRMSEISRPTFYLHYESIHALLDEMGSEMISSAALQEMMQLTLKEPDAVYAAIYKLLLVIENNRDFYRLCVLERGVNSPIPTKISEVLNKTLIQKWADENLLPPDTDRQCLADYMQASFNAIVSRWIDKREKETPQELAKTIAKLMVYGLSGYIGRTF